MADGLLLIFLLVSYFFVLGGTDVSIISRETFLVWWIFLIIVNCFVLKIVGVTSRNFTIENKCDDTIWPGIFSSPGFSLSTTGFILKKGEARVINMPSPWRGRFWGRSLCATNSTGGFSCATGDCGSGKIECSAAGMLPVTLAEFSIGNSAQDFYDVSVVDGYNLPLGVVPLHPQRGRECSSVGCVVDLNKTCPPELKVGREQPIACMSACQKFKDPVFCCTNTTREECQPTLYSKSFKSECPLAYSYPLDDTTSTFTCPNSPNYVITFCPSTLSNTTK